MSDAAWKNSGKEVLYMDLRSLQPIFLFQIPAFNTKASCYE